MRIYLGDLTPIRAALAQVQAKQEAARDVKDDRIAAVLGDVCALIESAIHDAARPPERGGLSPAEYAEREGISRWAVYKKIERGELAARRDPNGHLRLPAA